MKNKEEYLMLREEMTWRQKVIDTLGTFTYTVFISILSIALSTNNIELFLLPFVVILPVSLKVAYHKYGITKISVYLKIFLEDINDENSFKWENIQSMYYQKNPRGLKEKTFFYGSSVEYIVMCILTTILFWIKYFMQDEIHYTVFQVSFFLLIQLIVIFLVAYVTIGYTVSEKKKPSIIPNWEKVKEEFK